MKQQSTGFNNQITQIRDNSIKKDNWNLFVGDTRYKTNFFLQFKEASTKSLYERQIIPSSIYSIRLFIIFICLIDFFCIPYPECDNSRCLGKKLLVLTLALISFNATRPKARTWSLNWQNICLMLLPIYWSNGLLQNGYDFLENGKPTIYAFLFSLGFFLPTFLMSLLILPSWIDYLLHTLLQTSFLITLRSSFAPYLLPPEHILPLNQQLPFFLQSATLSPLLLYIVFFSLFEKIRKEAFVVGLTNSKTKKLTLQLMNQMPSPLALVSKKGQILFCNVQFEHMLKNRLGTKSMPASIFKLVAEDEASEGKLKGLVEEATKVQQFSAGAGLEMTMNQMVSGAEKIPKVEILLSKQSNGVSKFASPMFNKKSLNEIGKSSLDETRQNFDKQMFQKEMFEKYEIAQIKADQVVFNAQKVAMLTFNLISEQKAKNQLLMIHSHTLIKFLMQFNKRIQQLFQKMNPDDQQSQEFIEFIGSLYLIMNRIQQIQHELADMQEVAKTPEENFLLKEEILQIVESLSVKCLSQKTQLKLDQNKYLPEKLAGDINRFRLCVQSIVEFATKYCKEGFIDFSINFDGMTDDQKYLISFDITFDRNITFNDEPLFRLMTSLSKSPKSTLNDALISNFDDLFDLILNFGLGIIIFPSLVQAMSGQYSVSILDVSPNSFNAPQTPGASNTISKQVFMPIPSESGEGGMNSNQIMRSSTRVKINFKLPFNHPEGGRKFVNPYFPLNPSQDEANGKKVYKSPLLKTREYNNQVRVEMKKMMEASKSPLCQARPINQTNFPQVSPFAGLLGGAALKNTSDIIDKNAKKSGRMPEVPPNPTSRSNNLSNGSGGQMGAFALASGSGIGEAKKTLPPPKPSDDDGKVQRRSSAGNLSYMAAPNQSKLVKKVESTLLNLEKKQPSNLDFFKQQQNNGPPTSQPKLSNPGLAAVVVHKDIEDQFFENPSGNPITALIKEQLRNGSSVSNKDSSSKIAQAAPDDSTKNKFMKDNMPRIQSRIFIESDNKIAQGRHVPASMMISSNNNSNDQESGSQQVRNNVLSSNAVANMMNFKLEKAKNELQQEIANASAPGSISKMPESLQPPLVTDNSQGGGSSFHSNFRKKSLFSKGPMYSQTPAPAQLNQQLNIVKESEDDLQSSLKVGIKTMIQKEIENQARSKAGEAAVCLTPNRSPMQLINDQVEEEKEQLGVMVDSSVEGASESREEKIDAEINYSQLLKENKAEHQQTPLPLMPQLGNDQTPKNDGSNCNNENEISAKFGTGEGLENFETIKIIEEDEASLHHGLRDISRLNIFSYSKKEGPGPQGAASDLVSLVQPNSINQNHQRDACTHSYCGGASKNLLIFSRIQTPKGGLRTQVHHDIASYTGANPVLLQYQAKGSNSRSKQIAKTHLEMGGHNTSQIQNEDDLKKPNNSEIKKLRKNESFEEEELKSQEIVFPYRRGRQTLMQQERLKARDYEAQSTLITWDRALERQLREKREEEMEMECANVTNGGLTAGHGGAAVGNTFVTAGNFQYFRNGTIVDSKKRYVLVVEDNRMISEILDISLRNIGIVAIVAENGKIAVEKFKEFIHKGVLFDMVLMDIIMPEMGGYEATTLIRKVEEQARLGADERHFICGFSAEVNQETTRKCKEAGMDDILPKPMSTDTLQKLVDKNKRESNIIKRQQNGLGGGIVSNSNSAVSRNAGGGLAQTPHAQYNHAESDISGAGAINALASLHANTTSQFPMKGIQPFS